MTDLEFITNTVGMPYCLHNKNGLNCWGVISEYYSKKEQIQLNNYTINNLSPQEINNAFTIALTKGDHGFVKTDKPQNGTVVLFRSRWHYHCGLWFFGKVLHSQSKVGVAYQPLSSINGFETIEYWRKS